MQQPEQLQEPAAPERQGAQQERPGRPRHRPAPRPVEVVGVERLGPRMISVSFGGERLEGFPVPAPTAHIKLFLPDEHGQLALPAAGPDGLQQPQARPIMRTYTPRRYNPATNILEVQFVLHGDGPASRWAAQATPGDRAAVGGPGGRFSLGPEATRWWIAGDESALPAIATLLDALPDDAQAQVHLEVDGPDDQIAVPARPGIGIRWHLRADPHGSHCGTELIRAARLTGPGPADRVWVACEAGVVRQIRTYLLAERSLPRDRVTTRGYWRLGEANHPDHDYGED